MFGVSIGLTVLLVLVLEEVDSPPLLLLYWLAGEVGSVEGADEPVEEPLEVPVLLLEPLLELELFELSLELAEPLVLVEVFELLEPLALPELPLVLLLAPLVVAVPEVVV